MRASIILCTRNRAEMLKGCLGSILDDSSIAERELLIVDNGSTDGTGALAQRFLPPAASAIPVRYLRVEQPGKSHALNAAIHATKGDLLLFVDDDVLVQDGWADALIRGFVDPSVGAVGGRVLPQWPFEPPRWLHGPHARRY